MSERVYLHIGAPKTGTTYLQQVLSQNQEAIRADGVTYPTILGDAHHTAVWDIGGTWERRKSARKSKGHWDRVVRMSQDWPGRAAVISSELFVYLSLEGAAKAIGSFGDTQVHVIYTARDLVRQAPAVWQERIKNQYVLGYSDFLDDLLGPGTSKMAKGFWRAQDAVTALARWSQGLDPSHVHVVTAPPSGSPPLVLWERFASVLGLDPGTYSTEVPPVNPSMSPLAAETLRRFNLRRGSQLTKRRYGRLVKSDFVQVLVGALEDDTKLTLNSQQHEALTSRSNRLVSGLKAAGYHVVGSLDELVPAPPTGTRRNSGRGPDQVIDAEVIDALNDVVFDLLKSGRHRPRGGRNAADDVGTEG